jgi:hypothetical protein
VGEKHKKNQEWSLVLETLSPPSILMKYVSINIGEVNTQLITQKYIF